MLPSQQTREYPMMSINISESIVEKIPRILRGGAFLNHPALVRSAVRLGHAPASRYASYGFRPSRTYH